MRILKLIAFVLQGIYLTSCGIHIPPEIETAYEQLPDHIQFNIDIKPLLADRCFECHGPDEQARKAGLRFDNENDLFAKGDNGHFAFFPGNLNKSEAISRILSDDPDYMMPPPNSHRSLNHKEKAALIKWVKQGAEWKDHWAFIPPDKVKVPMSNTWTTHNPIDNFIHEKLTQNNLSPSPIADKEVLLRRVTIDLTGLPPSLKEIEDFINDTSPDAYAQVVDRLLNSTAYAERMTLEWLDVARYADSHGFHADGLRDMWPWRDWVINAFKENMPYDQFVSEQLAGDLMPNATREQIIATAFNRNHPMTAEGGAVEEEFRLEYVANRTNTLGTAFIGLTVECARCHDHKFDPVSQKEYYQLSAFFNSQKELGMTGDDGDFGPMVKLTDQSTDQQIAILDEKINKIEKQQKLSKQELAKISDFINAMDMQKVDPALHHSFELLTKTDSSNHLDGRQKTKVIKAQLSDGVSGNGILFDHQSTFVAIKDFGQYEMTESFSVSVWINPAENNGKTNVIIGNAGEKNNLWRGWDLYLDSANHAAVRLISSLPHNYIHVKTADEIPPDQWTHLMFTYDGSAKAEGIHLYVNGKNNPPVVVFDDLYKSILPTNVKRTRDTNRPLRMGKSYRNFTGDFGIYKGKVDELSIFAHEVLPNQIASIMAKSKNGEAPTIYISKQEEIKLVNQQLKQLRNERIHLMDTIPELMVMKDMENPRKTYILARGEYDKPQDSVTVGTPEKILSFTDEYPQNRLGLSQWLFDQRNPLTSRVAVNRYWQMIFGKGIVSTARDFGSQGALPSHPQLLDWLANEFVDTGYDVKQLIRLMVMSYTYQQRSNISQEDLKTDPTNKLLARGPSYRWQAEFIRDNALAASGLLNDQIGGESVKPYQPEGLWIELGNFSHFLLTYERDKDEKQYRRSMYTFVRRTSPPPFMTLFDAPSREVCTITRERTNTPLQALALLNDPQFQEASRALAFRLKGESNGEFDTIIENGFRLVLTRTPTTEEKQIFQSIYQEQLSEFSKDVNKAKEYLAVGDYRPAVSYNPAEMAALSVVSNTLFNMDEAYMKR